MELRPDIPAYLEFYLSSWRLLSDDRYRDGFGAVGAIPYLTMRAYCEDADMSKDQFQIFLKLLKALDREYLSWIAETRPKGQPDK